MELGEEIEEVYRARDELQRQLDDYSARLPSGDQKVKAEWINEMVPRPLRGLVFEALKRGKADVYQFLVRKAMWKKSDATSGSI